MTGPTVLATVAAQWAQLAPARYPSVHKTRTQLREHDDREQFPAGIDVTLTGIETVNRGKDSPFGSNQGFTGSRPGLPSERDPPPAQRPLRRPMTSSTPTTGHAGTITTKNVPTARVSNALTCRAWHVWAPRQSEAGAASGHEELHWPVLCPLRSSGAVH